MAEMVVACGLFSVFMVLSIGLFVSMTRLIGREQKPAELLSEGRTAALAVARRLRNCQAFVEPTLWQVLQDPTDRLLLRDSVFGRTVEFQISHGILTETYFPIDFDPKFPERFKPFKSRRLTAAKSFLISSGGVPHPTRLAVDITLSDEQKVRVITNLREAI